MKQFPEEAKELFNVAEENAKWRYNGYKRMSEQKY
jgi:pyruvate-ferredoxin/flavodoxin oxidoreductase